MAGPLASPTDAALYHKELLHTNLTEIDYALNFVSAIRTLNICKNSKSKKSKVRSGCANMDLDYDYTELPPNVRKRGP
ncbi:hypothetical protein CEP51_016629 [Fusarium floridanum]|uniref:Uncharacterized protein n=1 Tax=Fusarium floridanum TaxID=1325733 RepID=A0A428NK17_9HYPO|nr:hypothetical protein CEP51_016629 [Fusarium floridanum]